MGLIVSVYRNADTATDCTNGGISSRASRLCLVNVPGPFNPSADCPAAMLMPNHGKTARIVPCVKAEPVAGGPVNFDGWQAAPGWFMMGGNYAAAVLKVWGTDLKAGDIAFTVLFNGTPTPRAELPPEVCAAAEAALREHHPRHARYFLDGK